MVCHSIVGYRLGNWINYGSTYTSTVDCTHYYVICIVNASTSYQITPLKGWVKKHIMDDLFSMAKYFSNKMPFTYKGLDSFLLNKQ